MSTTYDLACPSLKVKLWVGQRDYLYSGEEHINDLAAFLHATKGHPLFFVSEHNYNDEILNCVYFDDVMPIDDGITRMDAKTAMDMLDNRQSLIRRCKIFLNCVNHGCASLQCNGS